MRVAAGLKVVAGGVLLLTLDALLSIGKRNEIAELNAAIKKHEDKLHSLSRTEVSLSDELAQFEKRQTDLNADIKKSSQALHQKRPPRAAPTNSNSNPKAQSQDKSPLAWPTPRPAEGFDINRVVMGPKFCSAPPPKNKLPKFLFVAGVEGSGHHALLPVWAALEQHVKVKLIVYDQLFHSLGIENHASYHYSSIRPEVHKEHMRAVFEQAAKDNAIVIDAQNSFPMGKGAGSLAHPDVQMMLDLDGVLFDLRVIVLQRDPATATLSAVRRFHDDSEYTYKTHEFQARVVTESLAHLNNIVPLLPCGKYAIIHFEDYVAKPIRFIGPLARLLGVPKLYLQSAFSKVHKNQAKVETKEQLQQRAELNEYFAFQQYLWPLLAPRR
eukprot:m.42775 g.42775  ORF g.42775 m.42775 type:complete len:383 (-) comp11580_c0_seq2:25-1173(-)